MTSASHRIQPPAVPMVQVIVFDRATYHFYRRGNLAVTSQVAPLGLRALSLLAFLAQHASAESRWPLSVLTFTEAPCYSPRVDLYHPSRSKSAERSRVYRAIRRLVSLGYLSAAPHPHHPQQKQVRVHDACGRDWEKISDAARTAHTPRP